MKAFMRVRRPFGMTAGQIQTPGTHIASTDWRDSQCDVC
jgi:hypothetical protein